MIIKTTDADRVAKSWLRLWIGGSGLELHRLDWRRTYVQLHFPFNLVLVARCGSVWCNAVVPHNLSRGNRKPIFMSIFLFNKLADWSRLRMRKICKLPSTGIISCPPGDATQQMCTGRKCIDADAGAQKHRFRYTASEVALTD
ncbi:uncharacterized protein LOC117143700 [Drosophila mauritiana]|uniref:Uncharacterized protein LOC117143700 n=1 Tax=Drosophila mauritiana TaxID=7226 RepID=A0A6P8K7M2_DROMA|nr:uncharacterized protein LOC117143700 [Drosophila mauritiana]